MYPIGFCNPLVNRLELMLISVTEESEPNISPDISSVGQNTPYRKDILNFKHLINPPNSYIFISYS